MAAIGSGDNRIRLIETPGNDASPVFFLSVYGLRELCIHPGNINAVLGLTGAPPLHYAVRNNDVELVRILLRNGADVNLRDATGDSPLLMNCWQSFTCVTFESNEIFHLLLESGADVNARDLRGLTALHLVRCHAMVRELLQRGADVHARDYRGRTPLDCTYIWSVCNSKIAELLHWSAELDKSSEVLLFQLVEDKACGMELFRRVFEGTGHADIRDAGMGTPLHCAVRAGRADLVRLLLDCGASVEARQMYGWTPLLTAVHLKCGVEMVSDLIRAGADVNTQSDWGHTPLRAAFLGRNEALAGLLLSAGADPDVEWYVSPFHPCAPLVVKHSVLRNYDSRGEYAKSSLWTSNSLTVKQCLSEIGAMKRTRLSEDLALYDVAFGGKWDISCAREVYESMSSGEYPMYSGLAMPKLALNIKKHLGDGANNNSLFMQGLSKKSSFRTNQHVLLQIVKYLSDEDCLNFYIAGCAGKERYHRWTKYYNYFLEIFWRFGKGLYGWSPK